MRTLLVLLSLLACLGAPAFGAETAGSSPRLLVHLLDYVAQDYAGAVRDGKVLSASEYHEQVEFIGSAHQMSRSLEQTKAVPTIQSGMDQLEKLVHDKASPADVAKLAQQVKAQVIQVSGLSVAPTSWPSLARGKELFAQSCVACHGATGHGDGPASAGLNPKPANFFDPERMNGLSPFKAFNAIRVGVPGTAMAPFNGMTDSDAWALAFYVMSLRHQGEPAGGKPAVDLRTAATTSDADLFKLFPGNDRDKHGALAALRTSSGDGGGEGGDGGNTVGTARSLLQAAVTDFGAGRFDSAKHNALTAYLEGVEPIEPRLRANDPAFTSELEAKMSAVRGLIEQRASSPEFTAAAKAAFAALDRANEILAQKAQSNWLTFLIAAGIMLREGFEAVLILVALLAVINAAGARRATLWVHAGWLAALGCGGLAWIFSGWLIGISGAQREMMEAVTSLAAVLVLLYMGFWLHSKTEISRWTKFINERVKTALEGKNLYTLATISFMAVFREAFEVVLFLRAVSLEGGKGATHAMAAGVFGSLIAIFILSWALLKYSAKVPIRKVFAFSSSLMAVLAVILTGKGLHSLQETGNLPVTAFPLNLHWDLMGFYPTRETLVPQLLILVVVAVLWQYGKKPTKTVVSA